MKQILINVIVNVIAMDGGQLLSEERRQEVKNKIT